MLFSSDDAFWNSEFRVENHGFVSAQSIFWIVRAYIYLLSDLKNAVNFNSGHNISTKRICFFLNRLNVVKEKAFSEVVFCTYATSKVPVMMPIGKNLVLWNFTYFNVVVFFFCAFVFVSSSSADGNTSGLFCEPLTKIICICMCNAHKKTSRQNCRSVFVKTIPITM